MSSFRPSLINIRPCINCVHSVAKRRMLINLVCCDNRKKTTIVHPKITQVSKFVYFIFTKEF